MDERVRRLIDVLGVLVALALALAADLHHELPIPAELDQVMVGLAVAAEPNKPFGIGVDAVLDLRPVVALPRPAPGLDKVSGLIELQHRRRRLAFLVCSYRARPLQDPRVAALIDRHARYLAPHPLARQLGPGRIDLELRDFPRGWTLANHRILRSVPG